MDGSGAGVPPEAVQVSLLAGRYEVTDVLGYGGMGEVRAGRDRRLDRDVAIKLLRADMAHQPAVRDRFENEARMAARLVHPHVVAVFDSGEENGIPYLVMERLSGKTLADEIAGGPLPYDEVRKIGLQILDALDAAHRGGMIHRDVKPRNIMAAGPGCWKVGDFGIAKSLEMNGQGLTMTGLVIGTPTYLAPERLAGGPATASGDLYGAGVVLYEALTGGPLLEPGTPPAALLTAVPRPLSQLRPDVPAGLAAVVMRAIDRDPSARFASAAQMAAALRRSDEIAPVAPTVAFADDRPGAPSGPGPTQVMAPHARGGAGQAPRRRGLVWAAAGAVLLIALCLIVLLSGRHGASNQPAVTSPTPTSVQAPARGTVPPSLDAALRHLDQTVRP